MFALGGLGRGSENNGGMYLCLELGLGLELGLKAALNGFLYLTIFTILSDLLFIELEHGL